jgi:hypothetical protein
MSIVDVLVARMAVGEQAASRSVVHMGQVGKAVGKECAQAKQRSRVLLDVLGGVVQERASGVVCTCMCIVHPCQPRRCEGWANHESLN